MSKVDLKITLKPEILELIINIYELFSEGKDHFLSQCKKRYFLSQFGHIIKKFEITLSNKFHIQNSP